MQADSSSPSVLEFKPDFEDAKRHWAAFWQREIIDRPLIHITAPKDPDKKTPPAVYMEGHDGNFETPIANMLERAANTYFGGDAMPSYTPSFGPDMFAAFMGADLQFSPDSTNTNWAVPFVDDWDQALPLKLDEGSVWWQRMLEFMRRLAEATTGKMLIAHIDLHSNMDALLAIRTGQRLCEDLMDQPEVIDRAMREVRALYVPIYDALYEAGQMSRYGTKGWVPAYHDGKTNTVQCDFACMVGPAMFRRYILPALEEETAFLDHSLYHYDGPVALVHLDDILGIETLDGIQWTPGSGDKPFIEWMDLFKRIQNAGKNLYIPCSLDQIPIYQKELKPEGVFYCTSAPSVEEADKAVDWLVRNT